ncbi:MAG: phosphoserine phosphatase SerB [Alphaproteobacteria bacterium]|nr:phosphoserine phosphatase SerB [Alphaproteobacteria bacterium]
MVSVLVLLAAPGSGAIGSDIVALLDEMGAGAPHWLAPGEAAEVPTFPRLSEFLIDIRKHPIDAVVVSANNRRKRLLVADMDSTMIDQECIDELAAAAGVGESVTQITARAMAGELDFEEALTQRVRLLRGLDLTILDRILKERISLTPGGATLVATMKAHGAFAALVSGGFTQFTEAIGRRLGFDERRANRLIVEGGKLAGEVARPILGQEAKVEALREIAARLGIEPADAIAVGDGANDLAMLAEAGMGVALHAKPLVQENSLIRVNHGDLTALLYLQGYSRAQFVTPT